jgi:ABC-type glycerol-3-phosphate transport system substrate-binding protein
MEEILSPLPPRNINIPEENSSNIPTSQPDLQKPIEPLPKTNSMVSTPIVTKKTFDIKKILPWLLIILVIIILFSIFSRIRQTGVKKIIKSANVELNYWGIWEESAVMQSLIADFEAKNPNIKINYKKNLQTDYRTRLKNRLAKTETQQEDVPDIYRIHASWLPMFREELEPVPLLTSNAIEMETDFFDVYKRDLKAKGGANFLAIPLMYDGLALYYNKDLLDQAGVSVPKTWNELRSAAEKIIKRSQDGKIEIAGVAAGLVDNVDHWSDIVGLMLQQGSIDPVKAVASDDKKIGDVLTYYTLLKTKYNLWDETLPNSTQMFASGKLGFYFGPSWRIFNIEELSGGKLNYEITSVPQLELASGELTNIHWATYWVEGVNSKSEKKKEAWKFLEYLASKEALEKSFTNASQIRKFGQIYPRKSMSSKISTNPKIAAFVSVADNSYNWYLSSRTFDNGLNDEMIKYFGDAINGMSLKNKGTEEVVVTLKSGIGQLITKYRL